MPFAFHGMLTVRRAMARLLAAMAFGTEADRWSGLAKASELVAADAGPGTMLLLPEAFRTPFSFPCKVAWVPVGAGEVEGAKAADAPHSLPLIRGERWHWHWDALLLQPRTIVPHSQASAKPIQLAVHAPYLSGKTCGRSPPGKGVLAPGNCPLPLLTELLRSASWDAAPAAGLVAEQQALLRVLVEERRLLRQVADDPARLEQLINTAPGGRAERREGQAGLR